ncbi:MAG: TetR/AcrR family transcriptional regulator [Oscillospiraceae bacterium]|nr:TetR/AcrR family transcriptional regulator [Oscillospiraceae bacterium]
MPKIIDNLKPRLISEARRQVSVSGYGSVTVRSVAAACGVGVGTVYNYFPAKDALIAAVLLEDWAQCMERVRAAGEAASGPEPVLRAMYEELYAFADTHSGIFRDAHALPAYAGAAAHYHAMLRMQRAEPLRPFCAVAFTAEFIAVSMLTWTMAGKPFEEIHSILNKLF